MSKLRIFAFVSFMVSVACLSTAEPRASTQFACLPEYCDDVVECPANCGCTCDGTTAWPNNCGGGWPELGYCAIMPEPSDK